MVRIRRISRTRSIPLTSVDSRRHHYPRNLKKDEFYQDENIQIISLVRAYSRHSCYQLFYFRIPFQLFGCLSTNLVYRSYFDFWIGRAGVYSLSRSNLGRSLACLPHRKSRSDRRIPIHSVERQVLMVSAVRSNSLHQPTKLSILLNSNPANPYGSTLPPFTG